MATLTEHEITTIGIKVREEVFTMLSRNATVIESTLEPIGSYQLKSEIHAHAREVAKHRAAAYRVLSAIVNSTEF